VVTGLSSWTDPKNVHWDLGSAAFSPAFS